MASNRLRQAIFGLFVSSPALEALGLNAENISPNFSPDGPAGDRFLVMRWGTTTRGVGSVNQVRLGCWAYNRQPDYFPVVKILEEVRRLLPTLVGVVMSPSPMEAVLGVDYEGDSDDLYDDGYRAYTRWTSHTITASGS